jgi:hypothetical protein
MRTTKSAAVAAATTAKSSFGHFAPKTLHAFMRARV